MKYNKTIIISAVNLVEGGGLSILKKCVQEVSNLNNKNENKYKIIVLVNSKSLLKKYDNVILQEYSLPKKSWLFRIFYEYVYFYFYSLVMKPLVWISLHDMTPNVRAKYRYVYMHNPSPFFQKNSELKLNWKFKLFIYLYKYIYIINVKKNNEIIVQQEWFREKISELCKVKKEKIIVAYPEFKVKESFFYDGKFNRGEFFYNAFPRDFKNFEIICRASELLISDPELNSDWNVYLTIDGSENEYSHKLVQTYKNNTHIHFIGLISRNKCEEYYRTSECLIFPSLLETWGLPISEYKIYQKKMIIADLPYAHETASGSKETAFFNPYNEKQLAMLMKEIINNKSSEAFNPIAIKKIAFPFCENWESLLHRIIPIL